MRSLAQAGGRAIRRMQSNSVIHVDPVEDHLKRKLRQHFRDLGFSKAEDGSLLLPGSEKEHVRQLHAAQRNDRVSGNLKFISECGEKLLSHFANGRQIDPSKIKLRLIRVPQRGVHAEIFRLASLTWSVPVSLGFGRRMRYLVWDDHHDKLVGIFALGDPVFNLNVRDKLIGWTATDRKDRLVSILDAYVLGAIPPYNMLLGGKAVACAIRSMDVFEDFAKTYGGSTGIISGKSKIAKLLAVTTSSSMGRSSIYNRLKLGKQTYFRSIGYTTGWGHFHINDHLFTEMRKFLRLRGHRYADEHSFGQGPNWRLRTIRAAIGELGLNQAVLKHGIRREVFYAPFGANAPEVMRTGEGSLDTSNLLTVAEIGDLARERWMVPRSKRRDEFRAWERQRILDLVHGSDRRTASDVADIAAAG